MSDPQEQQQPPPPNAALIRVNNNAVVEWHIDNYQPGSKVKVDVDPDPGGGKHPVAEAVDANTDPSNGAGKFATVISKKGFFTYTVSVTKPSGGKPETATFTVSAQPLTITKLEAAGGSKAEVGKPLKLDYSVDRGQGVKFTLHTKGPNEETDTPVTIDKDGNGTVTVTPKDVGTYKFQINSEDPTLQKGQKNPSSFEISVEVTPALTIKADFVAPTYEHFDFRIQKNVQLPHTFRKKDGKPMIRANRKVRFTWSVDSPTDLSAVGKIQITESKTGDTSDAVFDKKARSAAGDQMVTIKSDATADEEHTLSVVVLGADGKELTRKDVPLVLMPLSKDRADMIEILDFWFPSSLLEPRKDGGKPTKEQDIMAMAGWTVQKGKDSKAEKDAGKVPTTSCGDVLATVLRLWKSTFVGAFAIIDEGVEIPPDKPQLDPKTNKKPGARFLGYFHDAASGETPEPGDMYQLWDVGNNRMGHIGFFLEQYESTIATADGGAGKLPDQAALLDGSTFTRSKKGLIQADNPTTNSTNEIRGWVDLSKLSRDMSKKFPP